MDAFTRKEKRSEPRRKSKRRVPPLPEPPQEQARASRRLAGVMVSSLRSQGFPVEPPERAAYYVLKNPKLPSLLIEMGFMSNEHEGALLEDPAYQERLADALARGLGASLASAHDEPAAMLADKR